MRLASDALDDTFLVISGDALCDIDLTKIVEFHKEKGAAVTIGLKSVENPLEFGIVVTDEDGKVERFLEKPSWGQVFSDTINTGIYVLEPEVLKHVPTDRPYDFSKELFPLLLEMGRPIYGYVCEGYWQDIGNLDQYRQANFDALDETRAAERPRPEDPRRRLDRRGRRDRRRRRRRGAGVHRQLRAHLAGGVGRPVHRARLRRRRCASAAASRARCSTRSCYIGRSAVVEGAIVGRNCDIRAHARIHEGVAIGDQVTIGDQSVIYPGVRIYPYKEVDYGAQIYESLIWESRGTTRVFSQDGVVGLVNVDLTPEIALRFGAALGTALKRGARVVASRESAPAYRMIKRALISGPALDRRERRRPAHAAGPGREAPAEDAGLRRRVPRRRVDDRSGGGADPALRAPRDRALGRDAEGGREALHAPGAAPRPVRRRRLDHLPGAGARELRRATCSPTSTRRRSGDAASASSSTTATRPAATSCRSCSGRSASRRSRRTRSSPTPASTPGRIAETIDQAQRLVAAVNADFGAVFDRSAERLYLIDERGREVRPDQALLLYLKLAQQERRGGKVVVPITATSQVEEVVGDRFEVVRTPATLPELTRAAAEDGVVFAGAPGGGLRLPGLPAGLRRDRGALQAARAARAGRRPALEARRRSCRGRRSSTGRCSARGRSRVPSCAC